MPSLYKRIERWYPLTLGSSTAIACSFIFYGKPLPESASAIFAATAGLAGVVIGFLATTMPILYTISDNDDLQRIKAVSKHKRLINYFLDAINHSFVLLFASLAALFFDVIRIEGWQGLIFFLWLFSFATTGMSSYRFVRVFVDILRTVE